MTGSAGNDLAAWSQVGGHLLCAVCPVLLPLCEELRQAGRVCVVVPLTMQLRHASGTWPYGLSPGGNQICARVQPNCIQASRSTDALSHRSLPLPTGHVCGAWAAADRSGQGGGRGRQAAGQEEVSRSPATSHSLSAGFPSTLYLLPIPVLSAGGGDVVWRLGDADLGCGVWELNGPCGDERVTCVRVCGGS